MKTGFRRSDLRTKQEARGGVGRARLLLFFVMGSAVAILARLYFIQIVSHGEWGSIASGQYEVSRSLQAKRGQLFFHDHGSLSVVAVNRDEPYAFIVPRDIRDEWPVTHGLSEALGMDRNDIGKKMERKDDPFEIVKKRLSDDEVAKIKSLAIPGVHIGSEMARYYPGGEFAAPLIGFVASRSDGEAGVEGKYGLEAALNAELQGKNGHLEEERDSAGRWISLTDRVMSPAQNGDDFVLTIDRTVQFEAERILKESIEQYAADGGTIVVMEPKTGNILAMATLPQFDPNKFGEVTAYETFLNGATSVAYEPGSVMKPLTMAMGIEEGKVNPNTEYVDTGSVTEAGYHLKNAEEKVYGRSNMYRVLDQSINTGVIFVERLIGNATFRAYMQNFGFGEKAGIGFPGEVSGNLRNMDHLWQNINFFTSAFGQGVTATPLQLVRAYAALANGGVLMKPRLVEKIIHGNGVEEMVPPEPVRRVVSEETAKVMGDMLRSVVVNGHGKRADVPGYLVGGKTGTAQVAKTNERGYDESLSIGSFVGYAPLNDPKFAISVKFDHPRNVEWAESSAAPVFGKMMKFLLEYYQVEPTEPINSK
jgi:cell division protein FtsI/penicillin-binding protein 2